MRFELFPFLGIPSLYFINSITPPKRGRSHHIARRLRESLYGLRFAWSYVLLPSASWNLKFFGVTNVVSLQASSFLC